MSYEITTIKLAYEQENLTPEQIAELEGLDVTAVKAALMQCSTVYRKACNSNQEEDEDDGLNFTKDEMRRVKRVIIDLALGAEDEHLRGKMAVIARDDWKGRRDPVKALANQTNNIFLLNEKLASIRSAADRIKSSVTQKAINV